MIQHGNTASNAATPGDLISEIRSIRATIASAYGNDVDRLCDHLQQVERDYAAGRGPYATITRDKLPALMESWGTDAHSTDDAPIVAEIRGIRRRLAEDNR